MAGSDHGAAVDRLANEFGPRGLGEGDDGSTFQWPTCLAATSEFATRRVYRRSIVSVPFLKTILGRPRLPIRSSGFWANTTTSASLPGSCSATGP